MSNQLITNLTEILDEKTAKIIPENIKSGVQIFDVTGTYSGGGGGETIRTLTFNTTTPAYVLDFGKMYEFLSTHLTAEEKSKLLAVTPTGSCDWAPTFAIGSYSGTHIEICFDPNAMIGNFLEINLGIGDYAHGGQRIGENYFLSSGGSIRFDDPMTFDGQITQLYSDLKQKVDTDTTLIFCCKYSNETSFGPFLASGDNYVVTCSELTVFFADDTTKTISMQNADNFFIYSVPEENRA